MLSRNAEMQNYGVPSLNYSRNPIEKAYNHKTTAKSGELTPFYCSILVNPGDTIKMNMSFVARMLTPYYPVMDNAYIDFYWFQLPWIYSWDHVKEFFGENLMQPFESATEYTIPIIKSTGVAEAGAQSKIKPGDILDHLGGLPINTAFETDRLGYNTYLNVYNNYFRDQNLIAPIYIDKSDADVIYGEDPTNYPQKLLKVAKSHDYFTSAIPEPQKGVALTMPFGSEAPVFGNGNGLALAWGDHPSNVGVMANYSGNDGEGYPSASTTAAINFNSNHIGTTIQDSSLAAKSITNKIVGVATKEQLETFGTDKYDSSGLYADLSAAMGATLNAMRPIVAISHIQEKMGIYGSRYKETLSWGWGVNAPSLQLGVAEYLGGKRVPINIETVLNTTDANNDLGDTGAFSITADADYMFTKSFDMHSVLLGVFCIRNDQTYSQGIDCQHSKRRRYDFYHNELKGLGMQPIYNKELMVTGKNDNDVYGYKAPWQEYRVDIDHVSGLMRPNAPQSLAKWTYANNFVNRPTLSQEFIEQPSEQISNTLKVTEGDQFFLDIHCEYTLITEIPQWMNPGLEKF